jgi:hypothetical protein
MKQFIVLTAVLPILLIFMTQLVFDQKNNDAINQIQALVYAAKENAKQEGCFTKEIKAKLRRDLGDALGIAADEVVIESSEEVKYRYSKGEERLIRYRVEVPVKNVMAGAGFFRMKAEENTYRYVIDSYTASEKIA